MRKRQHRGNRQGVWLGALRPAGLRWRGATQLPRHDVPRCPHCSDKIAAECLKAAGWVVEAAIDVFYRSGYATQAPGVDTRALDALFETYKGAAGACVSPGQTATAASTLQCQPACCSSTTR